MSLRVYQDDSAQPIIIESSSDDDDDDVPEFKENMTKHAAYSSLKGKHYWKELSKCPK